MKMKPKILPILLCVSVVLTTSILLTQRIAADDRETEHVTFTESIMVGGSLLEADNYRLVWEGTGPQVKVSFMKGSKTLATVPATLIVADSSYSGAIETKTSGDNSKVLEKITWKKKALVFNQPS